MGRAGAHARAALGRLTMDASAIAAWLREFARLIADNKELLTQLDSAIGDADHGTNLDRGMTAVVAALEKEEGGAPAALLTPFRKEER